jgi:L-Ala-D/L-Glu epimerase
MLINDIQWRHYRLPFVSGFRTAHGALLVREGIILMVMTGQGICGLGEIAPLPAFAGGSLAAASALLPTMAERLCGQTLQAALDLVRAAQQADTPLSPALCGLEIALLDALAKARGCQVAALLAAQVTDARASVAVNAVIDARSVPAAAAAAQDARRNGFRCVKLKVGLALSAHAEIERVEAVRVALGPEIHLRLDANEAWRLAEASAILSGCASLDIQYVEQPLKAGDLAGMRALRRAIPIPLAADEAVRGPESARLVLASEAADILVIKAQLAGGLQVAQQMILAASQLGVGSVITSALEAGIGVAAGLHLAAATPAVTLECGLATLQLLQDDLLHDELPVRAGSMAVPSGPGLGVDLDRPALDRYSA